MTRLDPGYSGWRGAVMRHHNYAQLQMLKLQLEVGTETFLDIFKNLFRIEQSTEMSSQLSLKQCGAPWRRLITVIFSAQSTKWWNKFVFIFHFFVKIIKKSSFTSNCINVSSHSYYNLNSVVLYFLIFWFPCCFKPHSQPS